MFAVVAFSIWTGIHSYLLWRVLGLLQLGRRVNLWLVLVVMVVAFAYVFGRILNHTNKVAPLGFGLEWVGAWWMGFAVLLFNVVLLVEIVGVPVWIVTKLQGSGTTAFGWLQGLPVPQGRLAGIGLLTAALGLAVWGAAAAFVTPGITMVKAPFEVPEWKGKRMVQLTDQHLGAVAPEGLWERVLDRVAELEPDALLITGDLVEDFTPRTYRMADRLRARFPDLPVYAVTGNHEFYSGPEAFMDLAQRLDMRVFRQEVIELAPGFFLGGVDDRHFAKQDQAVQELKGKVPDEAALLLMSHRPEVVHRFADRPKTLVLAGHVHGGQLPPFQLFSPSANGGFLTGSYTVGQAVLSLSNGSGYWGPPMRVFAPSEIVVVKF